MELQFSSKNLKFNWTQSRENAWEKGEANQQGYFTLKNPASQKALTTDSEGFLTIEGKDLIILLHFLLTYKL